ncbi:MULTISPECIES: phage antirepressor KilAC domain-containing protein [unclassified Rhodococcus (in: high G+C Gram-positive bacteria)]|uniref:phage antirepressor KilAC domain-containing protein n=1 Tax=unclassified Rhodococcus (in: high G+C Gram-positive bacteria) TaxID=192944 RepID=UPI001AE9EA00|nr:MULTISPECIES: phage antirepressor KilAC domain-containing protein [unclassified Rhodococcus (in: high G+C Gram-positive bacteria)]MBP2524283.1 DNA-damage-inducible protein D [Rhodococcus sp. PvP104]MDA3637436.1 phage antirepressor KilAC domain-containing protein [Rhodococcus sp. C-2]
MSDLNLFNHDESPFDSIRQVRPDDSEFWSARDLMSVMGYGAWREFKVPIDRAMKSAANQGHDVSRNFGRSTKMSSTKPAENFELSRFAAYLVAMNGDPNKSEVAAAQAYFAIRTREAETAPTAVTELSRLDILKLAIAAEEEKAELQSQVAALEPKAAYVDIFVACSDVMTVRTVASTLGVGETWLRAELIARNWIYAEKSSRFSERHGKVVPQTRYSEYADKKAYFQRCEAHDAPRFRGEVMHTLKITPAGAQAIARAVRRWTKEAAA